MNVEPKADDVLSPQMMPDMPILGAPSGMSTALIMNEQPSVTGRSTVPIDDHAVQNGWAYANRRPYAMRPFFPPGGPNHNQVDVGRIQSGMDVRTTVRLSCFPLTLLTLSR